MHSKDQIKDRWDVIELAIGIDMDLNACNTQRCLDGGHGDLILILGMDHIVHT